jgi:multidrug/hemolysin transport system permease protein
VLALFFDTVLLVLFGTALSSLVCYPLSTQGQLSAVGSIVSAGYGFLCGAYMPISQFSDGLRTVVTLLPGTYGTSLLRNHALEGAYREMTAQGFPPEAIQSIRDTADCNLYFFGNQVQVWQSYLVLIGAIVLLTGGYILLNILSDKKRRKS